MAKEDMETYCLKCGRFLDSNRATDGEELSPEEGDISICFYCGNIAQFDKDRNLIEAKDEQIKYAEEEYRIILHAIRKANEQQKIL